MLLTLAPKCRCATSVAIAMLLLFVATTIACYGAMPDMQNVARPNPDPGAQVGWDVFAPPVTTASALGGTPTIAEWTRTGVSDNTLALTGDVLSNYAGNDQGKDTRFVIYGQTAISDGVQATASIQRLDGNKASITLPAGLPAWSTYLLWPRNSTGYGYPVAVNQSDAWWLGPNQASCGDTVSVYGRNLSHGGGTTTSWVYIKPAGTAGQFATVTSVNPYRVQFTVPNGLANGTYEVWVHNGHGGSYGWSGPLSLPIVSAYQWNGSTFNVTSYGATGDGVTDDSDAINTTYYYAQVYRDNNPGYHPTVYFPAGTYMVRYGYGMVHDIRTMGAGMNQSYIKCNSSFNALGLLYLNGGGVTNMEIKDLTLDGNGYYRGGITQDFLIFGQSGGQPSNDVRFTNVRVTTRLDPGKSPVFLVTTNRATFTGCEFIGGPVMAFSGSRQFAFSNCNFYGSNDSAMAILPRGASDLSVTNCYAADYDINSQTGIGQGRLIAGNSDYGTLRNVYVGDTTTVNCGPRLGAAEQNTGEQVMCEGNWTDYEGAPTSATATTVTFSDLNTSYVGDVAVICNGKGLGQHRDVTAYDAGSKTITVSPAWNVIPDATSDVLIARSAPRWVVYHNNMDGKDDYAARYSATTAIEPFGGCYDWIGDSNTITNMYAAICCASINQNNPFIPSIDPVYFNYYANNIIQSCYEGLRNTSNLPAIATTSGVGYLGNVFTNNSLTDITTYGARLWTDNTGTPGVPFDVSVFEHSTFTNVPQAVECNQSGIGSRVKNALFYKNVFNRGTAPLAGSFGIDFGPSTYTPDIRVNSWLNFQTTYAGSLPGGLLEVPNRPFEVLGTAGGSSQTAAMTIWNAGTSSLSWTATSDSAWLTLSSGSGTVADETASSSVTLTCNPTSLAAGTYTGTVTVTGASQTKKVVVTFTVSPVLPASGMKLWLKADVGVTKDGNNMVSAWADQSGNGNDVTPYWTYQAQYVPAAINNWPALYFDGGCDNYRKILSSGLSGNFSMFAVCSSPYTQVKQYQSGINNRLIDCPVAGTPTGDAQVTNGSCAPFAATIRSDNFSLNPTQNIPVFGVGSMFNTDGTCGGDFAVTGYIPEVIIYNRALTAQERTDVATYLANKYAIPPSNTPPSVTLTTPSDGTVYTTVPATISLAATASDSDGINHVDFLQGTGYLNSDYSAAYSYDWTGVQPGTYILTARAYDNAGTTAVSAPVTVRVNAAPTVSITAPTGGSSFTAPATINITASPADVDGTIGKVEFYNNGLLLGTDTSSAGGWTYSWTNVEASGTNGISLTAKAYDNDNVTATSSAVLCTTTDSANKCYWKFDENTGTSAGDSSGTGNAGTITGASWTTGKISYALSFNGTSNYVQKTSATGLPAANATQTECFWYYVSANPAVKKTALAVTGSSSATNIGFISSSGMKFGVWRNANALVVSTSTLPTAGAWHHVAYVRNGSNRYLYIDGSQAATSTSTTDSAAATTINVGRTVTGADYWSGNIDEVRIYNRALSATEIAALATGKQ